MIITDNENQPYLVLFDDIYANDISIFFKIIFSF